MVSICVREVRSWKNAKWMHGGQERRGDKEDRQQAVACRRTIIMNSCLISGNHLI